MANISITDLQPAGSGLFAGAEGFIDSMRDLSENELRMTRGGGSKSKKSKSSKSSKSGSGSGSGSCGCGYHC
jgi:hypothetical protein